MGSFYTELAELAEKDLDFVLCTVERAEGSTPRHKGAMMAVYVPNDWLRPDAGNIRRGADKGSGELSDTVIIGSIGGGRPEYECILRAQELLAASSGSNADDGALHFELYPEKPQKDDAGTAMTDHEKTGIQGGMEETGASGEVIPEYVCGGSMDVSLRLVRRRDEALRSQVLEMAGSHKRRRVYIFGGGHVCRALVPVLASVDFEPVVYEERPEFAGAEQFPSAAEVICAGFNEISKHVQLEKSDYAAIMTRGHIDDHEVLRQILSTGVEYIGLMGSRSKRKFIFERLASEGFTEADTARIHNPIGLDIGSETPEEIAISIAAELIAVRAGKDGLN